MASEVESTGKYVSRYVRVSKIKELFKFGDKKIRISADAVNHVTEQLDNAVISAVENIIRLLPRKTKGESKGNLKRFTIKAKDFVEGGDIEELDEEEVENEESDSEDESNDVTELSVDEEPDEPENLNEEKQ